MGGIDGGQQIAAGVRLHHVTATAHPERVFCHPDGVVLAHEDDARLRGNFANPARRFYSADSGQADIQQDDVGMHLPRFLDGFFSVDSLANDLNIRTAVYNRS